jgi:hypothetical protein
MASGAGGQIALIKTGSLYHTVDSANLWTNFTSEGIEHQLEELEEASITGNRFAPPSHKGLDFGEGDISFEPNPNAIGHFLMGAFGTIASSLVTDADSTGANSGEDAGKDEQFHRFTLRKSAYSERSFLEPYGVMVHRDVGSSFLLNGAIFTGFEMSIAGNALTSATVTVMGREMRRINRIAAITSLVSSGGRPWVWDMASIEVSTTGTGSAALAANQKFEEFTWSLESPQEGVVLLDGTKFYAEFQPNDFQRVNISGTQTFRDQDEYDAFVAYENRRFRITMTNVNTQIWLGNPDSVDIATDWRGYYGMRVHFPKIKYLSWSAPVGGPNRLQATFTAKAEYDDTEGEGIYVELKNVIGNSVYVGSAA